MHKSQIGAILLVSGTTIGAAMVALPTVVAPLGLLGAFAVLLLFWALMSWSGLLFCELTLAMPAQTHLVTMAHRTLGPVARGLTWFIYLALLYSLCAAYLTGLSETMRAFVAWPQWVDVGLIIALFMGIHHIGLHALDTSDAVFVQSTQTSGEVEIVIYVSDKIYIGVGSDHTDRALETVSIPGSKQACVNHLATKFWIWDDIADSWDDCILRSWVDGRLYQEVGVDKFLSPPDVLSVLRERVSNVPKRDFIVYCGTYVSVDKALGFGSNWRYQLEAPKLNRQIDAQYEVIDILKEVKDDFRVPFFNPQKS